MAAALSYFGGWLLLPVANYPTGTITSSYFTVNVIGAALPSNLGVTKAVVIPVVTLIGITLRARRLWANTCFAWPDYCLIAFCLWPFSLLALSNYSILNSALDSAYLLASWGCSWLIGRLIFSDDDGREMLLRSMAWSGVVLLPASLIEGVFGPAVYSRIYGEHAFLFEGSSRYLGHRPLAFFEHGNQFGIWICMAALAWIILVRNGRHSNRISTALLVVTVAAAVASQSVGAIALLLLGAFALCMNIRKLRRVGLVSGLLIAVVGGVYFSGAIPIEKLARNTAIGQEIIRLLRASGRHTIGYRISRDQMALSMIYKAPLSGYGIWDWWRPLGSHPWGLPLLIAGQFGIVSLGLSMTAILGATARAMGSNDKWRIALALIVLMSLIDAGLNSYIYFPSVVAAGAISATAPKRLTA